jgi:hypothetical protein
MVIDRGLVRATAVTATGLALVIGLIWAVGGFRPALAGGRAAAVGEPIELARWTVVVERAEYVDTSLVGVVEKDPAIRVWLRITNTTDKTLLEPQDRVLAVQVDGTEYAPGEVGWGQLRSALHFDPDVEARFAYDFPWTPPAPPAPEVVVVVRGETMRKNFVVADNWVVTAPAAAVRLPCPDLRQRR